MKFECCPNFDKNTLNGLKTLSYVCPLHLVTVPDAHYNRQYDVLWRPILPERPSLRENIKLLRGSTRFLVTLIRRSPPRVTVVTSGKWAVTVYGQ